MIIIRMTGGLGNQMFQYALYLKLCSMGREVKFDDITEYEIDNARPVMLWAFGLTYPRADKEEINKITDGFLKLSHRIRRKLFGRKSLEYQEKDCNYDPQVLQRDPAYLTGYFQSEKYFMDVEGQVRRAFTFSDKIWERLTSDLRQKLEHYLEQIESSSAVAIHVRRGDYLNTEGVFGGICTEVYYQRAVGRMLESLPEAVFFVFSNDKEWVKGWIPRLCKELNLDKQKRFVVIEGTTEDTGYLDMLLISKCQHFILANSSFSWWGAWLNSSGEKLVITPSTWFNNQNCRDIYTQEMIKISAKGEIIENEAGKADISYCDCI